MRIQLLPLLHILLVLFSVSYISSLRHQPLSSLGARREGPLELDRSGFEDLILLDSDLGHVS